LDCRERAIPLLKDNPQWNAKDIKKALEDSYNMQINYQRCWYGKKRAA
jgi:hypothetical protein